MLLPPFENSHAATWLPKMPSRGRSNGPSGGCRKDGEPPSGSKSLVLQSEGTPCRPTEGTSVLPLEGCRVFTPPEGRHHLPSLQREHTCAVCTRGTPCSGCAAVNSPNIFSVVFIFAVRGIRLTCPIIWKFQIGKRRTNPGQQVNAERIPSTSSVWNSRSRELSKVLLFALQLHTRTAAVCDDTAQNQAMPADDSVHGVVSSCI